MRYNLTYDKHGAIVVDKGSNSKYPTIVYRSDKDAYVYDTEEEGIKYKHLYAFLVDRYSGRLVQLPGYNLKESNNIKTTKGYVIEDVVIGKGSTVTVMVENYGSDLPNVEKFADPLSRITGKGAERIEMDRRDHHQAYFYNGVLSGFMWFGKGARLFNYYKEISKSYSHVGMGDWSDMLPSRNRPADMFIKLYGKEAERLMMEAIEVYKQNNPDEVDNEYFIADIKKSGL